MKGLMILLVLTVVSYAYPGYEPYSEPDSPESDYFFSGVFGMIYLLAVIVNIVHTLLDRHWKRFFIFFVPALILVNDLYLVIFSYGTFSYMFHKTALLVLQVNLISWGIVELVTYLYNKVISLRQTNKLKKQKKETSRFKSTDGSTDLVWEFGIDPSIHKRND